jgi:cellulose synthase/poly-beta-1,6-N-acetylglucosamine synthase-like glycosyltransferase
MEARGELIFTTDADCYVPASWLKAMVPYFKPGVVMVVGYSPLIPGRGLLDRILQFDNLFSAIAAAAPVKLGYAFSSAGRNLAYRRDAYEESGGFDALRRYRSGDDMHLTQRFHRLKLGKIDYCPDPESFVRTERPAGFKQLFNQQMRKNSKTLQMSAGPVVASLLFLVFHILLLGIPLYWPGLIPLWLAFLIVKLALELVCLDKAARIFGQRSVRPLLPLMQVIYPFYIVFFTILGSLQLYRWKS